MGVVFRALDQSQGRDVAIKILRLANPEAAPRRHREARATEGLDPSRVARVYEVGETERGEPFLVMEYVEGLTLREFLRAGAIERVEALRILREIARTLSGAHLVGVVHRDVKPDNVIVRSDGRVVVLDFGIVKNLDLSEDAAQVTTQLTSEGTMIGTPAYLAPEQALGREVTPAVDQFALAVTAFELLTGRLPWSATDVTRMLAQLLADHPPPASTVNHIVPKPFDAVLWRALAKSPGDRFSTIEAFVDALDAAEKGFAMASPASQTVAGPAGSPRQLLARSAVTTAPPDEVLASASKSFEAVVPTVTPPDQQLSAPAAAASAARQGPHRRPLSNRGGGALLAHQAARDSARWGAGRRHASPRGLRHCAARVSCVHDRGSGKSFAPAWRGRCVPGVHES